MVELKNCPDAKRLSDYAVGKLTGADSELIGEHLRECDSCLAAMENLDEDSDSLLRSLKDRQPDDSFLREHEYELVIGKCASLMVGSDEHQFDSRLGMVRDYRLVRELGRGGMGTVYEAIHTHLDRVVALKILPQNRMESVEAVSRFHREMRAVAKLDHPNIVRAQDAGEADGKHFLVTELVDGLDLSTLTRRMGPLRVADASELIRQAAIGIDHINRHNMVHRDIKPSNLMLTLTHDQRPLVKILDLGLALLESPPGGERQELTATGQMMGTAAYMAPEQGSDSHDVDVRADIYALGASLFKLLTGDPPFASDDESTPLKLMMAKASKSAPSVLIKRQDVPAELVAIIARMLATQPEDRFATPAAVADALAPLSQGSNLASLFDRAVERGKPLGADSASNGTKSHAKSARTDTPYVSNQESHPARSRRINRIGGWWPIRHLNIRVRVSIILGSILLALCAGFIYFRPHGIIDIAAVNTSLEAANIEQKAMNPPIPTKPRASLDSHTESPLRQAVLLQIDGSTKTVSLDVSEDRKITIHDPNDGKEITVEVDHDKKELRLEKRGFEIVVRQFDLDSQNGSRVRITFVAETRNTATVGLTPYGAKLMHDHPVNTVTFSNDGKMILAGCEARRAPEGYAQLWDVATGQPRGPKLRHDHGGIYAVAISPNRELLATGGGVAEGRQLTGEVRFWKSSTGKPINKPLQHRNIVGSLHFAGDSKTLLTGSWDFTSRIWNVESGEPVGGPLRQASAILAATFSPNERRIATGSFERVVRLWNVENQSAIGEPWRADAPVDALAYSPDGKLLVAGCRHAIAPVWDISDDVHELRHRLQHEGNVTSVACCSDGRYIVTGSLDSHVRLWDLNSGELLAKTPFDDWPVLTVAFSSDSEKIATGHGDGSVRLWKIRRIAGVEENGRSNDSSQERDSE